MRWTAHGLIVAACLFIGSARADDVKKELEKLSATYAAAEAEVDGQPLPADAIKDWKLTIKGDKFTFNPGNESVEGTFTIDPSKKPKTIDLTLESGNNKGQKVPGIYELTEDKFKICAAEEGKDRPTEFKTSAGSGQRYIVFKKEK